MRAELVEIEMVINSRLLVYAESEGDSLESLTLNHFLLGHSSKVKSLRNMSDDLEILKKSENCSNYSSSIYGPDEPTSIFPRYQHELSGMTR